MKTSEDVRKLCEEKQIRMIDFKMTDLNGRWRHVTISGGIVLMMTFSSMESVLTVLITVMLL